MPVRLGAAQRHCDILCAFCLVHLPTPYRMLVILGFYPFCRYGHRPPGDDELFGVIIHVPHPSGDHTVTPESLGSRLAANTLCA